MRLYRGKYSWQTLAKGKNKDGKELKKYITVRFNKNIIEPSGDEADVKLINWFFTPYEKQDGTVEVAIMVMEYTKEESRPREQKSHQNTLGGELSSFEDKQSIHIEPDDLPFY